MKKHKIYELIGRAVVYATGYIATVAISLNVLVYIVTECVTTIK